MEEYDNLPRIWRDSALTVTLRVSCEFDNPNIVEGAYIMVSINDQRFNVCHGDRIWRPTLCVAPSTSLTMNANRLGFWMEKDKQGVSSEEFYL
jgi:hypothetical protein